MPVVQKISNDDYQIAVWHIEESEDDLLVGLDLSEEHLTHIAKIKGLRKSQWLAARQLLKELLGYNQEWIYDECGKPFFCGLDMNFSISHSYNYVAIMLSSKECGVDIEKISEKIFRVKDKFCNNEEILNLQEEQISLMLHLIWGAKESIYKAYGKRNIDFRDHMTIDLNNFTSASRKVDAFLKKETIDNNYTINYTLVDEEFILVWAEKVDTDIVD